MDPADDDEVERMCELLRTQRRMVELREQRAAAASGMRTYVLHEQRFRELLRWLGQRAGVSPQQWKRLWSEVTTPDPPPPELRPIHLRVVR